MATILVVDDRPINREFIVTLLGYFQHEIVQAADGAEALALAGARHPDLVITDVLMPVMDGVEFVRRLHADPVLAAIPVIFYTATYRVGDAWQLAHSCGVDTVIGKPASPQAILDAVAAKLGAPADLPQAATPAAPGLLGGNLSNWMASLPQLHEHLQHLKALQDLSAPLAGAEPLPPNGLRQSLTTATTLSLRLAALLELGLEVGAERDLGRLLESFVRAGRDVMNAQFAAAGLVDRDSQAGPLATRGLPEAVRTLLAAERDGPLFTALRDGQVRHLYGAPARAALPAGHPPVRELLALPVRSLTRHYGWLYFADKLGAESFSDEDGQIASILATQVSLACENLLLFEETQRYAGELEIEVAARRDSEGRFRELAENIREVFWLADPALSKFAYVSPAYEEIWGRSCASLYADPDSWRAGVHPEDMAVVNADLVHLRDTGQVDRQFRVRRPDLSLRWVRSRGFPIRDAHGALLRIAGLTEDITEYKQQQDSIARLNRVLAVLSGINSAIVRIRQRPPLFEEACRVAVEHGQFVLAWIGRIDGPQLTPLAWCRRDASPLPPSALQLADGESHRAELAGGQLAVCDNLRQCCPHDPALADGTATARSRAILPLRENGAVVGVMLLYAEESGFFDAREVQLLNELAGDISFALDYISREERLDYLAYYDALTGLPNRSLFLDRLAQMLYRASRDGSTVAVILLNIDHFKQLNDSHGRHVGDTLLKQVAERLTAALAAPCSLGRVDADYAIALGALPAHDDAQAILRETIFAALQPAFPTVGGEVRLTARAGLALFPGDGDSAELLLSQAEIALRQAKACGARHCYFDKEVNARSVAKLALEAELREAVSAGQFAVYFQPKLNLHSGRMVSAEALIRWRHPTRGLVGPNGFIGLAEESGLIAPIGEWVLREVCAQQARWLAAGLAIVPVAVNLSAAQFRTGNVVDLVRDALAAAGLDARHLELELTESLVMNDPEGQVTTLRALRQLGLGLSLDDFGTGYSSLAYLKRFPFSSIKIDRAFVIDITDNAEDAAIVDAAIGIAKRLGMTAIAEGVETAAQMQHLRRLGCDEMQGDLFSRPLPAAEFEALLRSGTHLELPAAPPVERRAR